MTVVVPSGATKEAGANPYAEKLPISPNTIKTMPNLKDFHRWKWNDGQSSSYPVLFWGACAYGKLKYYTLYKYYTVRCMQDALKLFSDCSRCCIFWGYRLFVVFYVKTSSLGTYHHTLLFKYPFPSASSLIDIWLCEYF